MQLILVGSEMFIRDWYSKNRRDFEILRCIKKGMTLDETNEHLLRNGLNDLYDKRKNP